MVVGILALVSQEMQPHGLEELQPLDDDELVEFQLLLDVLLQLHDELQLVNDELQLLHDLLQHLHDELQLLHDELQLLLDVLQLLNDDGVVEQLQIELLTVDDERWLQP